MRQSTVLRRIYLFSFLDDFMVIYPLYAVMFADNGLSTTQISVLFIVWSIASLAFEIPTGVLADKYDRRVILAVGEVIRAGGYVCWLVFPNFVGFLVGFIAWGISSAFTSGTLEALVFDELKATSAEATYVRVNGRCRALAMAAYMVASLVAAPIANLGYSWPLILSVIVSLVTGAVALSLPKADRSMDIDEPERMSALFRTGLKELRNSRVLVGAVLFAALAGSFYGSIDEYASLFISDVGVNNSGVALIATVSAAVSAIAAVLAHRVPSYGRTLTGLMLAASGVALFAGARLQSMFGIALLLAFFFLAHLVAVIADADVQHAMEADGPRATVTSIANLTTELLGLAVFVLFAVAGHDDRFVGFEVCGLVLAALALVFSTLSSFSRRTSRNS